MNTLLAFQDDLSEKEIALFLNSLSDLLNTDGFEHVYDTAMKKIKEFPTCYELILNIALFLDGALVMNVPTANSADDQDSIEDLYVCASQSQDSEVQNRANSLLISKCIQRKEYNKAEKLLQSLPDGDSVDKKQIQANLYIELGKLDEAAKIEEEKLLAATNEMHVILMTLMEIALKENRIEDAEYIANVSKKGAELFDLWEYSAYVAHFQLYSACKKRIKCLKTLIPMLKSLTQPWDINSSPLYRHIPTKEVDQAFGPQMQKTILHSICADEETSFLREDASFKSLLREFDSECSEAENG